MTPAEITAARERLGRLLTLAEESTVAARAMGYTGPAWVVVDGSHLSAALDALDAANQSLADECTDNARLGESLVQVMQERNELRSCLEETETAKTTMREKCAELEREVERLNEHRLPDSCGEGCDACPPPNDCPLFGVLRDCVNDREQTLRSSLLGLVGQFDQGMMCGELEREVERLRKYLNAFLHPTLFDCRPPTDEEYQLRSEARAYLEPSGEGE